MDIDALVDELDGFTTELTQVTETTLAEIASRLPQELISGLEAAGKQLSSGAGSLRSSIDVEQQGQLLGISMNYYGYFQIFGVKGISRDSLNLPASVSGAFGTSKFEFTKIKHPGILPAPNAANQLINLADLIVAEITSDI
jgi:hypothetical protein